MKTMKTCKYGCGKMQKGGKVTAVKKMQKGGSTGIVGMPKYGNNPRTDEGRMLQKGGVASTTNRPVKPGCRGGMVKDASGNCVNERQFKKGGATSFGMLSVKAGVDKNPKPTAADRIVGAKKKMQKGGVSNGMSDFMKKNSPVGPNAPKKTLREFEEDSAKKAAEWRRKHGSGLKLDPKVELRNKVKEDIQKRTGNTKMQMGGSINKIKRTIPKGPGVLPPKDVIKHPSDAIKTDFRNKPIPKRGVIPKGGVTNPPAELRKRVKEDIEKRTGKKSSLKYQKGGSAPSAGLSEKKKSAVAKKASAGKDIGKPGKGFAKLAAKAGGGEKGKRIAAAAMWKNIKRG